MLFLNFISLKGREDSFSILVAILFKIFSEIFPTGTIVKIKLSFHTIFSNNLSGFLK